MLPAGMSIPVSRGSAARLDYLPAPLDVYPDMAVIDTLKLTLALRDKAGFSQAGAEATAEALNSALGDDVATKADIAAVKSDIRLLQWQIGIMYALQLAILVKLFVH